MPYPWSIGKLEVVVFDMDGTLLNSGDFGVTAILRAFEALAGKGRLPGVETPSVQAIRGQIGKPPAEFYRGLLPGHLAERALELHHEATIHENELLRGGVGKLFDGALDVLAELKAAGLRLALVSNCSRPYMDCVSEVFGLDRWLDHRDCVGDNATRERNKPALVGVALRELGGSRGVMVGDRIHDGEAAAANGLWFIGCTYGYGEGQEFEDANATINDIRELPRLILAK
jgi:phosphoglycolate phosphatase-like HAD superfamily hydrolase